MLNQSSSLGIVSTHELMKANQHLNFEQATKLHAWLVKKFMSIQRNDIDVVGFNNVVLDAVIADSTTYDVTKGTLLKYLQTSINFEVVKLVQNNLPTTLYEVIDDVHHIHNNVNPHMLDVFKYELPYDKLSDIEIETLYMVTQGASLSDARLTILKRLTERITYVDT